MNTLILGHNTTGKTTTIKNTISEISGKVIILDYSNNYAKFTNNKFELDDINPFMSEIGLKEAKVLNAGYQYDTHYLYKMCEEILKEYRCERKMGLVEEAIERLQFAWTNTEIMYGKLLNQKISTKVNKKHVSVEETAKAILKHDKVILKPRNMHSDHLRGITYILLLKISELAKEPVTIVVDDLPGVFNNGNVRLLLDTLNMEKLHFITAFNKSQNIPKEFYTMADAFWVHRLENNADIKKMNQLGLEAKKDFKKLKTGEYITYQLKKLTLV